jgi:Type IV secretion system pilin
MLFTPRVQTVGSISDFLNTNRKKGVSIPTESKFLPVMLSTAALSAYSSVASAASIQDKIIHAFDPLIELVQALAYPVGFTMICAGFLVIMTGNRHKGLHIIKWAAIGYIGMMFAPGIMAILQEVGRAIGK